MDSLDKALKDAKDIETQLNALDNKEDEKPLVRKMRFETNVNDAGKATRNNDRFIKKHTLDEYGLEELALCRMILASRGSEMPDTYEDKFQSLADKARKYTMTTDGSGTGAELIDTVMWNQLFQDIQSKTLVAELFRPWRDMVSQSEELPSLGNVTFYKPAGEGQAVTATDPATAKRTITAYTLKAQVDISDEQDEDAIIALIPNIRSILIRNAKETIDEAILNADASTGKTNINYYDAAGADIATNSRFLLGFDGLIHYCLNEVTGQKSDMGTLEVADFATLIGLLGKYADVPERCAFIVDRWTKNKAIQLDDFRTVDKLGAQATLLTGQIGQVYGVPVILSDQVQKSNATGQVDQTSGNNTKGRIVLVNRDMWQFGIRRNVRVAVQRDEPKTLTSVVVSMRIGLQCFGDRSSANYCHTALGYNVTV
ncbi:MAG: phage major capsid protein [Dehalococcoidales bacterium]|nr:phage major capsid protein [Dehalococcoidales bacterium]